MLLEAAGGAGRKRTESRACGPGESRTVWYRQGQTAGGNNALVLSSGILDPSFFYGERTSLSVTQTKEGGCAAMVRRWLGGVALSPGLSQPGVSS